MFCQVYRFLFFRVSMSEMSYKADADVMFLQSYKFNFTLLPLMSLLCFNVLHSTKQVFLFGFFGKKQIPLILCNIDKNVGTYPMFRIKALLFVYNWMVYIPDLRPSVLDGCVDN